MTIKIGRVLLSAARVVPFRVRGSGEGGLVGPFTEKGFDVEGVQVGVEAQGRMDDLERESLRFESLYVEDEDSQVPAGYYVLSEASYQKPPGAPRRRRWSLGLGQRRRPVVVRQAEDDFYFGSVVADSAVDEGEYVSVTPTASERVVLGSNDLVLALRLDEATGTDGSNLVTNPGFETYTTSPGVPDNWTNNGGNTSQYVRETVIRRSGANSLRIVADGSSSVAGVYQEPSLSGGKSYYFEAWARTSGNVGDKARVVVRNVTDAVDVAVVTGSDAVTVFEKLSGTFKAVAGKTYRLSCIIGSNGAIVYFDDVLVQEIQAKDKSGLGNHGTLSGAANTSGPTIGATGKVGTAYDFDGTDDYVETPSFAVTGGETCTIEAWVRGDDANQDLTIFGQASQANPHIFLSIRGNQPDNQLSAGYHTGSDFTTANGPSFTSKFGAYHHVVLVLDATSGTFTFYIDAVATTVSGLTIISPTVARAGFIGAFSSGLDFFDGRIDELRIYRRALTAEEVLNRYNATKGGVRPANDSKPILEGLNLPAGEYKLVARAYAETTSTARLRWRVLNLEGDVQTTGSQVAIGTANAWTEVDLGKLTVTEANKNKNHYQVLIDDPSNTNPVRLDRVRIVPA